MDEMLWVVYAILQQYVQDSLIGVGSLKGSPCEILSIVDDDEHATHTITFQWHPADGSEARTAELVLKDGRGVSSIDISSGHLIATYTDDTIHDAGLITVSLIPAYVVSGASALSSGWLSLTDGGEALTPNLNQTFLIVSTGDYENKMYRWNGTSYVLLSGGSSGGSLPEGGIKGQQIVKNSDKDGDASWATVHEKMSYSDYQALSTDKKNDGTIRFVTDIPAGEIIEGGAASLIDPLNVTENVGGIKAGITYATNTSFEKIFQDMLNPVKYPSFTAPSASLSATGVKLLEKGSTLNTTMTVAFNRGSISPAYGTSGFRSGVAASYSLNGGTEQVSNTFEEIITDAQLTYRASVAYEAGEQPKDSSGKNYDSPLLSGSVNSNTITYEFVNALWANTESIGLVAKLPLVSKASKAKEFIFPAATVSNPEVFDVPASWTINSVQLLNTLNNKYEDCSNQFSITDITHDDAAGTSVAYKRYTCNLGYDMGIRNIKITWN